MDSLRQLAHALGADERTVRRAAEQGAVRCRRSSPRRVEFAEGELDYLREHWEILADLRRALRTEPNVRFAVLFGSIARGDGDEGSDLDLIVELADYGPGKIGRLESRLEQALERPVELHTLRDAEGSPYLLHQVLRDGRVLVDRAGRWARLYRRRHSIAKEAEVAKRALYERETKSVDLLRDMAQRRREQKPSENPGADVYELQKASK